MSDGAVHSASLASHLPVLQIIVPFMAAPLVVLIGKSTLSWVIALIASAISLVISFLLLMQVIDGQVISYHLGGWAPPVGIEYRVDAANAFVLLIVSAISTITLPYARSSIAKEIKEKNHSLFYSCYLLCFTGLMGVTITGDAFNVFVFLEISSLSTYVLVAQGMDRDKRALTAAYDYLVMGTIGATFFVIGIGFLYAATGTLNMVDMAERISTLKDNRTVSAGFAFIVVGMGLKLAIYPLHTWLPNAYTYAPSAVTVFLASTATKVAVYVLLRFMFSVYSPDFLFETHTLRYIIFPFAIIAMFAASFRAIFQTDFKRLLAYSSVAQVGYMLLGISLVSKTGVAATMIHLFNHAVTKGALFMAVGAIVYKTGSSYIGHLQGLGKRMPITSAAIVLSGLSLIGVPATAGFVSKWVLIQAALEQGFAVVAFLIVASSLLAVVYVWRIVELLYFKEPAEDAPQSEAPLSLLVPTWILVLSCIFFGLNTEITLSAANAAADALFSGYLNGGE